jgi:hypothetical protein
MLAEPWYKHHFWYLQKNLSPARLRIRMVVDMSETFVTKLHWLRGYRFNVKFDNEEIADLIVDETRPTGNDEGPNPSRLLSASVVTV